MKLISRCVQVYVPQITTIPVAISDHNELMYMRPHAAISSVSTARSPVGIQALLDACNSEEYRATANGTTVLDSTSQTVGMSPLSSEGKQIIKMLPWSLTKHLDFSLFGETMVSREYNMQDFERVPVRYTQDFAPIQSPFRRFPSAVTATEA